MNSDDLPPPETSAIESDPIVTEPVAETPPEETSIAAETPPPLPQSANPRQAHSTPSLPDSLAGFCALSQQGRMSPAAETRAAELLRDALLEGRAEIEEALAAILNLPWPISVNGLNAAWPTMKPYGRRLFVTGMKAGQFEGENGRRIRLSLTRGLAKIDEPQAAKWACAIATELLNAEGALSVRDRQSFFNVFIGKGKPWLLRLPLAGIKETDVQAFLTCAIQTVYIGGCPPFTQSSMLQWMLGNGKVGLLDEKNLQIIVQSIRRWPGRLLRDFNGKTSEMPPAIAEAFTARGGKNADSTGSESEGTTAEASEKSEPVAKEENEESTESPRPADDEGDEDEDGDDDDEDEDDEDDEDEDEDDLDEDEKPAPQSGRSANRPVRPPYISPGQASRPGQSQGRPQTAANVPTTFDPVVALRQLDQFVRQQAQQLQNARTALRQREDDTRRSGGSSRRSGRGRDRGGSDGVWPETAPSEDAEALRRLVAQLETTNAELRLRLEDLASDGEQKADSLTAPDGTPLSEREQLCQYLALKLGKDHADFRRLQNEPADEVFCEHYRLVLTSVFEILENTGIVPKPPES